MTTKYGYLTWWECSDFDREAQIDPHRCSWPILSLTANYKSAFVNSSGGSCLKNKNNRHWRNEWKYWLRIAHLLLVESTFLQVETLSSTAFSFFIPITRTQARKPNSKIKHCKQEPSKEQFIMALSSTERDSKRERKSNGYNLSRELLDAAERNPNTEGNKQRAEEPPTTCRLLFKISSFLSESHVSE